LIADCGLRIDKTLNLDLESAVEQTHKSAIHNPQSRGEPGNSPFVVAQGIENSVVQAVFAPLPELDSFRFYAKAAPKWRAVDRVVFESGFKLVNSSF
jgi:hypothetical protein